MPVFEFSLFSRITTKIDDNVDISLSKLENTSMILLQLKLSNRESFKKLFMNFLLSHGRFYVFVSCNAMMRFFLVK